MLEGLTEVDLPTALAPRLPREVTRFLTGAMLAAVAIMLREAIQQAAPGVAPFAFIFPAVLVATVLSGWRSGALALVIAEVIDWRLLLVDPPGPAILGLRDTIELVLFTASAAALIFLTEAFVQSARASARARAAQVRQAQIEEERQRLIANELRHRVKNTLAVVQGMAQQSFRGERADSAAQAEFAGRLQALSAAHDLLVASHWCDVDLAEVVIRATAPFVDPLRPRSLVAEGPQVALPSQKAIVLTLALHELSTNATKYGAWSTPSGTVSIHWTLAGEGADRRLVLTWREAGGPPVAPPKRRGFGSQLIERALRQDLGDQAVLDFAPEGLICTIAAPLTGSERPLQACDTSGRATPLGVG